MYACKLYLRLDVYIMITLYYILHCMDIGIRIFMTCLQLEFVYGYEANQVINPGDLTEAEVIHLP